MVGRVLSVVSSASCNGLRTRGFVCAGEGRRSVVVAGADCVEREAEVTVEEAARALGLASAAGADGSTVSVKGGREGGAVLLTLECELDSWCFGCCSGAAVQLS